MTTVSGWQKSSSWISGHQLSGVYAQAGGHPFRSQSGCGREAVSLKELFTNNVPVSSKRRFIIPKTDNQKRYLDSIREYDIVFGIGPAGTGKTYLAMAMAVNALLKKQVSRIVLARPAIEAGEKLGFLPGDIQERSTPI